MISIFEYNDYKPYLRAYLSKLPKKGHGVLSQWAQALDVSTTLMSQILSGKKLLSLEMAIGLARLLDLGQLETDFLFLLVNLERAGNVALQNHFKSKIAEAQQASRLLKNRIEGVEELSEEVKAHYYASWIYSAIRNLVAAEPRASVEELAKRLRISRAAASEATDFLLQQGLIAQSEKGWSVGPRSIYLSSDSPLVTKHHQNWRLKSIQSTNDKNAEDLFFTSPMSLSKEVATELRKQLVDIIQEVRKKAGPSESETVRCLNIDWFEY